MKIFLFFFLTIFLGCNIVQVKLNQKINNNFNINENVPNIITALINYDIGINGNFTNKRFVKHIDINIEILNKLTLDVCNIKICYMALKFL